MSGWEVGPTAYAGPASPVRPDRTELDGPGMLWLDVLDATIRSCREHGRPDLATWLWKRRTQLLDPNLRVLVAGASKQGKSQLINALINAPVCVTGDDRGTAVPTVVRHTAEPTAALIRRDTASADWPSEAGIHDLFPLGVDRLTDALAEALAGQPAGAAERMHAEVGLPRALLAAGLQLIDTPPLPGLPGALPDALQQVHAHLTAGHADVLMLVCDASRELTDPEIALLADLAALFPSLVVAFTKIDYAPHWRRAVDSSRMRLAQAGVPATMVTTSAALRTRAARSGDAALNNESGYPQLIGVLQALTAAKRDRLARAAAGLLGRAATERLAAPLRERLEAQRAETDGSGAQTRLLEAQRRMDQLRKCTTRWQSRLADEVADLMSDIEHDLRERTRAVIARSDEVFAEQDPGRVWEEFEPWLRDSLVETARTSMGWLGERAAWLARSVAAEFPPELGEVLPSWVPAVSDELPSRVTDLQTPPVERFTISQKLFTGLRGSYGGVLMFGLATSLSGMSLINPISLGGGVVFGGKSIHEEGKSLLKRRQATARAAVQRHVDEIYIGMAKDAKDSIRRVQRALRDHFTVVTEDLQDAIVDSLRTAKAEAEQEAAERETRARRVEQELVRLAGLQRQSLALLQAPA
ncbi:dynamin family protein [Actinoplanes sp. NPDC051861]|uniref:dynamin family protein n=1 Tax=Actinoplanes sp. NPDC051861 TaxID=3155170 RepID=UPI003412248F